MKIFVLKLSLINFLLIFTPLTAQQINNSENLTSSEAGTYVINSDTSVLKVYVGRAGLLSKMGHNHIVISKDIAGNIKYTSAPDISIAKLTIPVHTLVVDDETERRVSGQGFESIPSESDIQSTTNNMLGSSVLDGDNHPQITAFVSGTTKINSVNSYNVQLGFKGIVIEVELNGFTHFAKDIMIIDTEFILNHSQLGLKPYSILGGMLRVAEQLRFDLHIEAIVE